METTELPPAVSSFTVNRTTTRERARLHSENHQFRSGNKAGVRLTLTAGLDGLLVSVRTGGTTRARTAAGPGGLERGGSRTGSSSRGVSGFCVYC